MGKGPDEWDKKAVGPEPEWLWANWAARKLAAAHPIEQVGERLRAMMPWIGANKLVDKERN